MMALKSTHVGIRGRTGADEDAKRLDKKARHSSTSSPTSYSRRPASRRVQAPVAPAVDPLEAATVAYIRAHADRMDKLMVSSDRPHVRVRADAMRSLAVPPCQDGPERMISAVVLDASIELLLRRRRSHQGTRNALLLGVEEQDFLEYLAEQDAGDMPATATATARRYLQHDMVLFLVNHRAHFFVAALNFGKREYQVLDSENYGQYHGDRFYEQALAKIRDGVGRCMDSVGRADVAGWPLRRVRGLPEQTDDSSCGLFALKWMELWDGERLANSFSMDDVHALRTKLAKELVFSELNEMDDVKEEIIKLTL